ncbi:MAG TPA: hypothetical protein VL354_21570 [Spirochaetia bacterium]|nr:hypothetical protein [Spirochaetia bacterium]
MMLRLQCAATIIGFLTLCSSGALCADPVTVTKVRILIGELRYNWTDPLAIPERLPGGFTTPRTVASFLAIAPGDQMSEAELERRRRAAIERLEDSGFFYTVDVAVTQVARREDGRLVVARLSEGFLWRFGGGAAYGAVGEVNLFGERKRWELAAGANWANALWEDDLVCGAPVEYRAAIHYESSLFTGYAGFVDYRLVEASPAAGFRLTPDLVFYLESPLSYRWLQPSVTFPSTTEGMEYTPQGGLRWQGSIWPGPVRLTAKASGSTGLSLRSFGQCYALASGSSAVTVELPFQSANGRREYGPALGTRLCYGGTRVLRGGLPVFGLFNLCDTPNRSVRSGYSFQDLLAASFLLFNAELRMPTPSLGLGSIFSLVFAPFVYVDAALSRGPEGGAPNNSEAFGGGLRLLFDNPVFAFFTFSYGWNPQGEGRFSFTATSGY